MPDKVVIGDATLYLGDCREILPEFEASCAIVSDPPYGIGFIHSGTGRPFLRQQKGTSFQRHSEPITGDNQPFDPAFLLRFSELILFGANHYADRLPPSGQWLVWDKKDGMKSNTFSDCELAWCRSAGNSVRIFRYLWNGLCQAGEKGKRVHPAQKPIALMSWCLNFVKAQCIIDPYMGSGSTGLAVIAAQRTFKGIEIEPKYFDIACRRIEEAQRQGQLFNEPEADRHLPGQRAVADLFHTEEKPAGASDETESSC